MFNDFKKKVKEEREIRIFYTEKITRNITPLITKLLLLTSITANQVTFFTLAVGLIATAFFVPGVKLYAILGSLLLILQHTLDAVDGEIARYRKTTSLRGRFLDKIIHHTTEPLLFIGIMFGVLRHNHSLMVIIAGVSASTFIAMVYATNLIRRSVLIEKVAQKGTKENTKKQKVKKSTFLKNIYDVRSSPMALLLKLHRKTLAIFFRWPEYHFVILLASIFNQLELFLYIYGIAYPIIFLLTFVNNFFSIKENLK